MKKHGTSGHRPILTLNCSVMVQHGIILLLIGPLVPSIMRAFSIGEATTGLLLGVGSTGFLFGPLVAGSIIDRSSVRRVLIMGFSLELAFLALFGVSNSFVLAVTALFLFRFASAFIEIGGNYLPAISPAGSSPHARMNLVHFFFSIGAFVGPFLIGLWLEATGAWRAVFFLAMAPTALLLLGTISVELPGRPRPASGTAPGEARLAVVLRRRYALLGAVTLLLYVGAEVAISSWVVHYLQKVVGLDTVRAASGLSILWIFIVIGRLMNGVMARRFSARTLVTASGLLGMTGLLVFLSAASATSAYLLLAVVGLGLSGVFPNVMGALNSRDPERAGTVTAVMSTGAAIGAVVFPWLVGIIADIAGLKAAFVVPAILQGLLVISFLFASAGHRPKQRLGGDVR